MIERGKLIKEYYDDENINGSGKNIKTSMENSS